MRYCNFFPINLAISHTLNRAKIPSVLPEQYEATKALAHALVITLLNYKHSALIQLTALLLTARQSELQPLPDFSNSFSSNTEHRVFYV